MKKIIISTLLSFIIMSVANAQYRTERTGYDGDYFSLEGAIELFKQSNSLRDFERKINSKKYYVNNLDLDYDGRIDYVRVEHRRKGDYHAIILQVPLSRRDVQDVAVIEIEKLGRRDAVLQIIGDADLYGEEVIVEPYEGTRYAGGRSNYSNDYVNVYYWAVVQDIMGPRYTVYASPYHWSYYPNWWRPWRPFSWNVYYPRLRPYYRHCHVVTIYRTPRAHRFYRPYRSHSHHVAHRTAKIRDQRSRSHRYGSAGSSRSIDRGTGRDRYGASPRKVAPVPHSNRSPRIQGQTRSNTRVTPQVKKDRTATRQRQRVVSPTPNRRSSETVRKTVPAQRKVTPQGAPRRSTYSSPGVSRQGQNRQVRKPVTKSYQKPNRTSNSQKRVSTSRSSQHKVTRAQRSAPRVSKSTQKSGVRTKRVVTPRKAAPTRSKR
ncbi:MAG: hypothetical protein HKN76_17035 [Saprospiraceae bacterium]|nr:hypothetical protein [Saprospiraceae bacterium]